MALIRLIVSEPNPTSVVIAARIVGNVSLLKVLDTTSFDDLTLRAADIYSEHKYKQ